MDCLIELDEVRFAYPRQPAVLRGINLRVSAGERIAVTGANGAGKSTLLRVMVGLLRQEAGRIVAFGAERRREADFREVRRRAGLVFQDPDDQLFCPTVAEDVAFGPLNLGNSSHEALAIVDETLDHLHLTHLRDRVTHKLSGGEKRLVSLAAVLAMKPDLLLLDEPTNALDEDTRERLREIILGLPQACVVVSHDADFRRGIATRELRLEGGRINAANRRRESSVTGSAQW